MYVYLYPSSMYLYICLDRVYIVSCIFVFVYQTLSL